MAKSMQVICLKSEPEYFCKGGWTGEATQCAACYGSGMPVENSPTAETCPQPASTYADDGLAGAKLIMNSMTTPTNAAIGSSHVE